MDQQKILVVDDEPDILELVQYNLEKEGFQVETASTASRPSRLPPIGTRTSSCSM